MRYNPMVIEQRPLLMQRLLDAVCHGYVMWTHGTVPLGKAVYFATKMAAVYAVDLDRHQRARCKRLHIGCARLILFRRQTDPNAIYWWLMVTPPESGSHPAHAAEQLKNALVTRERLEIDGYEMVRLTRPSQTSYSPTGNACKPAWTWRMTDRKYHSWRDTIISEIRSSGQAMSVRELMQSLFFGSPGFRGVRSQIGKLAALYRNEWRRRRPSEAIEPLPKSLGYVRRLKSEGVRLYGL